MQRFFKKNGGMRQSVLWSLERETQPMFTAKQELGTQDLADEKLEYQALSKTAAVMDDR